MIEKDKCIDALRMMLNSRFFEEKTEELFKAGLIHGTTHLANNSKGSLSVAKSPKIFKCNMKIRRLPKNFNKSTVL
ncbi:MAG: hypothetical protein IKO96_06395 [Spirochaetales bacterium]|nr:hypothetical protein [Spirochaetales bacterium]